MTNEPNWPRSTTSGTGWTNWVPFGGEWPLSGTQNGRRGGAGRVRTPGLRFRLGLLGRGDLGEAAPQDPPCGGQLTLFGGFGGELERVKQGDHGLCAEDEPERFYQRVDL